MDDENLDYFPRRKTAEERQAEQAQDQANNLAILAHSGLVFTQTQDGRVIFRSAGKPGVEYYPGRNRWLVRGEKKSRFGTVSQLIRFVTNLHGVTTFNNTGTTTKRQAEEAGTEALQRMRESLARDSTFDKMYQPASPLYTEQVRQARLHDEQTAREALATKITLTGRPVSSIIPDDLHIFDAAGNDLGRANVLIKGFTVEPGELISQAIVRCLKPGQTIRIVHGG